jgi:branched-subunit amino acid transport protein
LNGAPVSFAEGLVAIVGLALITLLTRSFFLLPEREVPIPGWLREALRFAPLAALVAVIAPQVLLTEGRLVLDWRDGRLLAAAAGAAWFAWRRDILGTIVAGSLVLFAVRAVFG